MWADHNLSVAQSAAAYLKKLRGRLTLGEAGRASGEGVCGVTELGGGASFDFGYAIDDMRCGVIECRQFGGIRGTSGRSNLSGFSANQAGEA
jgi:hypothetical protein